VRPRRLPPGSLLCIRARGRTILPPVQPTEPESENARRVQRVLVGLAGLLVVVLLRQLWVRIAFPWDGLMWSESPFMTDMLKLTNGQPVFTSPADGNSMIYSPGLTYLTYALLAPFDVHVDIRFCRAVTVLVGIAAAGVCAWLTERALRSLGAPTRNRWFAAFAALAFMLLVFRNHTSDTCHPDNLYALHASLTLALTYAAVTRPSYRLALAAMAFAGLGVLVKQTAVTSVGGAGLILVILERRTWGFKRTGVLALVGAVSMAASLYAVFHDPNARFFALEMVSHHHVDPYRLQDLMTRDLFTAPHRVILVPATAVSAFYLLTHAQSAARRVLLYWAIIGAFEVFISVASYFKILGTSNSLGILDLWGALLVIPVAWHLLSISSGLQRATAAAVLALFALALPPMKAAPMTAHYRMGRELDEKIRDDLAVGRRVLLSHGVMPFVHAGVRPVLLDRASAVWELHWAGMGDRSGMRERVRSGHYDKIYLWVALYSADLIALIEQEYEQVGEIAGDGMPLREDEFVFGTQGFMRRPIRILQRRTAPR
jgi:hypothetical protein